MELNKTEKKFLSDMLKARISDSERILKNSKEHFLNPNFPHYDEEAYEKQVRKYNKIIKQCQSITDKLN